MISRWLAEFWMVSICNIASIRGMGKTNKLLWDIRPSDKRFTWNFTRLELFTLEKSSIKTINNFNNVGSSIQKATIKIRASTKRQGLDIYLKLYKLGHMKLNKFLRRILTNIREFWRLSASRARENVTLMGQEFCDRCDLPYLINLEGEEERRYRACIKKGQFVKFTKLDVYWIFMGKDNYSRTQRWTGCGPIVMSSGKERLTKSNVH